MVRVVEEYLYLTFNQAFLCFNDQEDRFLFNCDPHSIQFNGSIFGVKDVVSESGADLCTEPYYRCFRVVCHNDVHHQFVCSRFTVNGRI